MSFAPGPNAPIIPGYGVYLDNNEFIGTVKAVEGDRFLISGDDIRDLWLLDICVAEVEGNKVNLSATKELLDEYIVKGADSPT